LYSLRLTIPGIGSILRELRFKANLIVATPQFAAEPHASATGPLGRLFQATGVIAIPRLHVASLPGY
jgi:hypothetical protein